MACSNNYCRDQKENEEISMTGVSVMLHYLSTHSLFHRYSQIATYIDHRLLLVSNHSLIHKKNVMEFAERFAKTNGKHDKLPVLIVGGGPVGLVLAIFLTKLGVKCSVLEKNTSYFPHPQAHVINNRSMELLRKIEGLVEEIERLRAPIDLWRKFIYCTSLTGKILASEDHMRPQDFEKIASPVFTTHFSHYKLTTLLLKHLEKLGFQVYGSEGSSCTSHGPLRGEELLMGHKCVSLKTSDQGITTTVSFFKDEKSLEREIECNILVGADGAKSTVRKLIGTKLKGERDMQNIISIYFFSKDLGRYLLRERPAMLFFIFNTQAVAMLVCHDLKEGEFVLQTPFFPPQHNLKDFTPEVCKKLICVVAGRELLDLDVMDVKPWVMNAEVAEKFLSDDNRIILVGDAAHRFPPSAGFGMNSGIQDAHNLAWKIASVMKSITPWSMLRTYETERQPIAQFNSTLSVMCFEALTEVGLELGIDRNVINRVHRIINYTLGPILPLALQRKLLNGILRVGFAQFSKYILNEYNPIGSSRLAKVRRIFEDGKSLHLFFPAEDIGFRYIRGAIINDGFNVENYPQKPSRYRREYVPCVDPGSRLPHMNVRDMSKLHEEPISTHDLVSGDKIEFLLIVRPTKESYSLARSAFEVFTEFNIDLKVCVLWPSSTVITCESETKITLAPWENYVDVVEVLRTDGPLSWWSTCGMTENGAILVRPDEHIAWCGKSGVVGDPTLEMKRVCSIVFGLKKE